MNEDYVAGFMSKAAELGVDPEKLLEKSAIDPTILGETLQNMGSFFGSPLAEKWQLYDQLEQLGGPLYKGRLAALKAMGYGSIGALMGGSLNAEQAMHRPFFDELDKAQEMGVGEIRRNWRQFVGRNPITGVARPLHQQGVVGVPVAVTKAVGSAMKPGMRRLLLSLAKALR
jgi:hypothetical protein